MQTLTRAFNEMCQLEPRLFELWMEASTIKPYPSAGFCANHVWFTRLKPRLAKLAGFEAGNSALRSNLCYDIAYSAVYYALPDCNHPGGCW
jgi:hypothetical protein